MLFVFVTVSSKFVNFAKLSEHLLGISAASCVLLIVRFSVCVFGADFGCEKQFLSSLTDGVASYMQGEGAVQVFGCFLKKGLLCICVSYDLREQILIKHDTRMLELEVYFPT
jgi:hypothetical protein